MNVLELLSDVNRAAQSTYISIDVNDDSNNRTLLLQGGLTVLDNQRGRCHL